MGLVIWSESSSKKREMFFGNLEILEFHDLMKYGSYNDRILSIEVMKEIFTIFGHKSWNHQFFLTLSLYCDRYLKIDDFDNDVIFYSTSDYKIKDVLLEYIKKTNIDMTISGHAHGGQWRIFGRGLYAPGQGFFPKYTSGLIEDRFIVSRGLANNALLPRFFNPRELIIINFESI